MVTRLFASMPGRLSSSTVAPLPSVVPECAVVTNVLDSPERCTALIGALADGGRHAFAALAVRVLGSDDMCDAERIHQAIDELHDLGMPLEVSRDAVRAARFAPLDPRTLAHALPRWDVGVVGSTASTNGDLLRTVRSGDPLERPRLLACELQRAGRGRLGRSWASAPAVSLTASFALRLERRLAMLDGITLVCGLAVRDAVAACGVDARLKWPNDLLFDDRKLAGILVEAHATGSTTAIVVGVGLNVGLEPLPHPVATQDHPRDALSRTDLATCGGRALDRNRLLVDIACALERRCRQFDADGFGALVDEWNEVDAFRDRPVRLAARGDGDSHDGPCGVARGVDATGALLLDLGTGDGPTRVISGDLSLRPSTLPR